jgi:hypothetical protein
VVFGVCLELLSGTLNLGIGNSNGISFTLLLVVHNFSFADWALLEELQSPFCLLACLLLFQTKNYLGLACLVFLGEF